MENRLRPGFQPQRHHSLRDSVRDSGNSKNSCPAAMRFRYFYRLYRRREVSPRRHAIPDPVEVIPQIFLEVGYGLPVHPGCTLFRLDPPVRLPYQLLRYLKRLVFRS